MVEVDEYGRVVAVSDTLRIDGLRLTGFHGVFEEEKQRGQEFVVDLEVALDVSQAASSDDLAHTLDYSTLVAEVATRVTGQSVDLIETLAEQIAEITLAYPHAKKVRVTVHKPDAPVGYPVDDISITIQRKRRSS